MCMEYHNCGKYENNEIDTILLCEEAMTMFHHSSVQRISAVSSTTVHSMELWKHLERSPVPIAVIACLPCFVSDLLPNPDCWFPIHRGVERRGDIFKFPTYNPNF